MSVKAELQENEPPLNGEWYFTEVLLGSFPCETPVTLQHITRFSLCLTQLPGKPKNHPAEICISYPRALYHFDPSFVAIIDLKGQKVTESHNLKILSLSSKEEGLPYYTFPSTKINYEATTMGWRIKQTLSPKKRKIMKWL